MQASNEFEFSSVQPLPTISTIATHPENVGASAGSSVANSRAQCSVAPPEGMQGFEVKPPLSELSAAVSDPSSSPMKKIQSLPYLRQHNDLSPSSRLKGKTVSAKDDKGAEVESGLAVDAARDLKANDADVQGYGSPENYSNWRKWYVEK